MLRLSLFLATLLSAFPASAMSLTSPDIAPGGAIAPAQIYPRCGGGNVSPALAWSTAPPGTRSFALTMIDTSVKPSHWSHWIVVGLPPDTTALPRGAKTLPGKARALASNFGDASYDGPCPPKDSGIHNYQLTIWALPVPAILFAPDAKATDVEAMLSRIALDHASLTGTVAR